MNLYFCLISMVLVENNNGIHYYSQIYQFFSFRSSIVCLITLFLLLNWH